MGQYHAPINIERMEYLEPLAFNDGRKLTEFSMSAVGTMTALAALLSTSNGRGYGDLHPGLPGAEEWCQENDVTGDWMLRHVLGRWANNRIAIVGDYWQQEDLPDWGDGEPGGPWAMPGDWINVSRLGLVAIGLDPEHRDFARSRIAHSDDNADWGDAPPVSLPGVPA
jgi:hypothetical protein